MKTMGQRIRQKRIEYNLSQEELGAKLGVKKSAISKMERGEIKTIDRDHIAKMAAIFHCSPQWLMDLESSNVTATYSAPGNETIVTNVKGAPIIGASSLRAQLYDVAIQVKPENLQTAINLLKSLS